MVINCAIKCARCGFDKHFIWETTVGCRSPEVALEQIHHMRRSKVRKLLEEHAIRQFSYQHRIYRCESCGQLRNAFWLKIVYDQNEIFETHFQCGQCRLPMKPVANYPQLNQMRCPCCGSSQLRIADDAGLTVP